MMLQDKRPDVEVPKHHDNDLQFDVIAHQPIQQQLNEPEDSKVDDEKSFRHRIPKWMRFYVYFVFKTVNGPLLLVQCALYSYVNELLSSYSLIKMSPFVYPNCYTERVAYLQQNCYSDSIVFQDAVIIEIIMQVCTLLIFGYIYDLYGKIQLNKNKVLLKLYYAFALMLLIALVMPSTIGLDLAGYRDFFFFFLMILDGFSLLLT